MEDAFSELTGDDHPDWIALSEGLCDYLSISYRRAKTNYMPNEFTPWWSVSGQSRELDGSLMYDDDWVGGDHAKGLVWATTLMDLEYNNPTDPTQGVLLGRDVTTTIILASLFKVTDQASIVDRVNAIISSDKDIYNGIHISDINTVFNNRGFLNEPEIPTGFSISGSVGENPVLTWDSNTESDLDGYNLYVKHGTSSEELLTTLDKEETSFTDTGVTITNGKFDPQVCYRLTAFDLAQNESEKTLPRCVKSNQIQKSGSIEESISQIPKEFHMYPAFPNPFNPSTKIKFDLPEDSFVNISIFDLSGRSVDILTKKMYEAGTHAIDFKTENLSSGVYIIHMVTRNHIFSQKAILIK